MAILGVAVLIALLGGLTGALLAMFLVPMFWVFKKDDAARPPSAGHSAITEEEYAKITGLRALERINAEKR